MLRRLLCALGLHAYRTIATYPDAPCDMLDECRHCAHRQRYAFLEEAPTHPEFLDTLSWMFTGQCCRCGQLRGISLDPICRSCWP